MSSEIITASVLITASRGPVVSLQIPPPPMYRSLLVPFIGDASASSCVPLPVPVAFVWSLSKLLGNVAGGNNLANQRGSGSSLIHRAQGKTLDLDSFLLESGRGYHVQLAALSIDGSIVSSATRQFTIETMPAAAILEGNSGPVRRDSVINLNATGSYDPDLCKSATDCSEGRQPGTLVFRWSCTQMLDNVPCSYKNFTTVSLPALPFLIIDLSLLQLPPEAANLLFEVFVSKASSTRFDAATQSLTMQVLPQGLTCFNVQIQVLKQSSNSILFRGLLGTNANVSYGWSVRTASLGEKSSSGRNLDISDMSVFPVGGARRLLLINPSATAALAEIPPGSKYTVSLYVQSMGNEQHPVTPSFGAAWMDLQREVPPTGGACVVQPTLGYALTTTFSASCSGWSASALPLQYRFAVTANQSIRNSFAAAPDDSLSWSPPETSGGLELLLCPGNYTLFSSVSDFLVRVESWFPLFNLSYVEGLTK